MQRRLIAVLVVCGAVLYAGLSVQAQVGPSQLYLPAIYDNRPTATRTRVPTASPTITLTSTTTATPTITRTPTATGTATTSPTATATPTITRTPTATGTATTSPTRTTTPTVTTTRSPTVTRTPVVGDCSSTPNPTDAPNSPVRIVTVFKDATPERVQLQNVTNQAVSIAGWRMCSITGAQEHAILSGTLAPGEIRDITSTAAGPIWNNSSRDDGALYDNQGRLISYWIDQ